MLFTFNVEVNAFRFSGGDDNAVKVPVQKRGGGVDGGVEPQFDHVGVVNKAPVFGDDLKWQPAVGDEIEGAADFFISLKQGNAVTEP